MLNNLQKSQKNTLGKLPVSVILVTIALLSPVANRSIAAQAEIIADEQIDCSNPQATPVFNYCAEKSYEATDKQLNQVYEKVLSGVSGEQKNKLIEVQQIWIKFRDDNCDFETYDARNGTGYISYLNNCKERLTKQRIAELEEYLSL